jgi:taurine dioxygenase
LFDYIEQDRFITEFQWQLGDIIIWDNRFLDHKAGD